MKKAIWLGAGGLVLVGFVVAGVIFGPRLYQRWFAPTTPLGRISKVETVETYPGTGGPGDVLAVEGYRLWVVHFEGGMRPDAGKSDEQSGSWFDKVSLIDDSGEKHRASIFQEASGEEGGQQVVKSREMVFSIPRDRRPHSLIVGDGPQVRLPAP